MSESWKFIPGFDKYEASTLGRIRSHTRKARILKPGHNKQGYEHVILENKGDYKSLRVNRLVAIVFIPNPLNLPQVNHKNGIKTDNRVENLEWVTSSQNSKHAYDMGLKRMDGLCAEKRIEALRKLLNKPIFNIQTGEEYSSIKEAAEKNNIAYANLSYNIRKSKNPKFKYK